MSNPFQPTGARLPSLFEFDEPRLTNNPNNASFVDLDQDGWPEYVPNVTASTGATPPYVYFDSDSYAAANLGYIRPYPTTAVSATTYPAKNPGIKISDWGVALPYVSKLPPNGTFVNPKKFQIISAGLDSVYGEPGVETTRLAVFPIGTNYTEGDQDNLTNFSEGTLKDAIP